MSDIMQKLGEIGVVPVIILDDAAKAVPLAQALIAGGINCIEITLRTAAGLDAIRAIAQDVPDMLVGAGTVLSMDQAHAAVDAGAKFIVSPGFDDAVVDWCLARRVPVLPGAVTPTEIIHARNKGVFTLKFFPADLYGGASAIKALGSPFGDVKFVVTGGVNAETLASYLKLPSILACGGSWMASPALVKAGAFDEITRLAREAMEIVAEIRGNIA